MRFAVELYSDFAGGAKAIGHVGNDMMGISLADRLDFPIGADDAVFLRTFLIDACAGGRLRQRLGLSLRILTQAARMFGSFSGKPFSNVVLVDALLLEFSGT